MRFVEEAFLNYLVIELVFRMVSSLREDAGITYFVLFRIKA